ncbi:MAG: tetratricopeptide repeat protein, partial [Candidatus Eremiobacteraeota bacterium]|nr:tetratricopeptide repeat protein [Candidatus Eremiobacteraeota bacterium]
NRLITIAGPGGIGKTRLALQAAADALESFPDGCWFIELDEVTNVSLVTEAVAATLHVGPRSGMSPEDALLEYLCERHTLLVLDNSEQVLTGVASFSRRVLDRCKSVSLLLTSREPTHIAGERVVRLGPLTASDATELFRERAGETDTGLRLSDTEMHDIHEICEHLDGIPLGIELASRHIVSMSASELRSRVSGSLALLTSKDPTESTRHRTLDATMEWSYRLLKDSERHFFDALSIFGGTFSPKCCEFVLQGHHDGTLPIELLENLIDKSFVTPVRYESETRYRLLDPIREFAGAKCDAGSANNLRSRLLQWCLEFAGHWDASDAGAMEAELPNIRIALDSGFSTDRDGALRLLLGVTPYWQRMQRIAEARQWYDIAISAGSDDAALVSYVYRRAATFATVADDYQTARSLVQRALEIAQSIGDAGRIAEAQLTLAVIEQRSGNKDRAFQLYDDALKLFREANHERGIFTTLNNQAMMLTADGKSEEARACYAEAANRCRMTGDMDSLASVLSHQGELALEQKSFEEAEALFNEALDLKRRTKSKVDVSNMLMNLGSVAFARKDYVNAERRAREALHEALESDSRSDASLVLELLAVSFDATGRRQEAVNAAGLAFAMRKSVDYWVENAGQVRDALRNLSASQNFIGLNRDWKKLTNELLEPGSLTAVR